MEIRPAHGAAFVRVLALVTTLAAALAANPASGEPVKNPTNVDIKGLKGTNGVHARLYTQVGGTVNFQAIKGDEYAEYRNTGTVTARRVAVGYGPYGSVDVRFHARKTERCHGKPFEEKGVFKGVIKFRGDHGYTKVKAHKARGEVFSFATAMPCSSANRRRGGGGQTTTTELQARQGGVSLVALKYEGTRRPDIRAYEDETKHGIDISRFSALSGPLHSFRFNRKLTKATLTPQPPFSGSGNFDSDVIDPTDEWTGNLSFNVLGAPDVQLAGQGFMATLSSSTSKAAPAPVRKFARQRARP